MDLATSPLIRTILGQSQQRLCQTGDVSLSLNVSSSYFVCVCLARRSARLQSFSSARIQSIIPTAQAVGASHPLTLFGEQNYDSDTKQTAS
jgi:hypothetical protein